jgi:carboxyl-terminal processing protease
MRGRVNTKVKLKIMRKGQDKPVELLITREIIHDRSVRSQLEGDDVGFLRIIQFNEHTTDGLRKAIAHLIAQSGDRLRGFIIDMRNNPGGLFDQAISAADVFLEKGGSCQLAAGLRGRRSGSMRTRAISPKASRLLL